MTHEVYQLPQLTPISLESRGLSETVLDRAGVGIAPDGKLLFPYYSLESGLPVAAKFRQWPDKEFAWSGDATKATWFGLNAVHQQASSVVLCEGESDTLSVAQALSLDPSFAVLGLAKGAGSAEATVKKTLAWLRSRFERIYLMFDNDEAGQEAQAKALALLPKGRTFIVSLPTGVKDANELLLSKQSDGILDAVSTARQVVPESILDSAALVNDAMEFYYDPRAMFGVSTGYPLLDKALGGFAPGQVTVLAGDTGVGKTTFATQLAYNHAKVSPVLFIPLEMSATHMSLKAAEFHSKKPLLSEPETLNIDPLELRQYLTEVNGMFKFYDHYGMMGFDELQEAVEVAKAAYGVEMVVLDHITAAAGNEWKDIADFIQRLKNVALAAKVHILALVHVNIDDDEGMNGAKKLRLSHVRGGKAIAQWSDTVLGIERDRNGGDTTVRTLKLNRVRGVYSATKYSFEDNRYVELGYAETEEGQVQSVSKLYRKGDIDPLFGSVLRAGGSEVHATGEATDVHAGLHQPDEPEELPVQLVLTEGEKSSSVRTGTEGAHGAPGQAKVFVGEGEQPLAPYHVRVPAALFED